MLASAYRERERRTLVCVCAPSDRGDRRHHAAIALQKIVGDAYQQKVGRGRWRQLAQGIRQIRFILFGHQCGRDHIGGGRRAADPGKAIDHQRCRPIPPRGIVQQRLNVKCSRCRHSFMGGKDVVHGEKEMVFDGNRPRSHEAGFRGKKRNQMPGASSADSRLHPGHRTDMHKRRHRGCSPAAFLRWIAMRPPNRTGKAPRRESILIMQPSKDIGRLLEIMAALRTPVTGCSWDVEQTFETIAPYTLEEAYEVADAIARGDLHDLREELGDLLLQVVFHARIAEEAGEFSFGDVVEAITTKMIRRHPHVFGDEDARAAGAAKGMWDRIKAEEKAEKRQARLARGLDPEDHGRGYLDGVPIGLPALTRALKLQEKAARVGFDWKEAKPILDKIEEEIAELREAMEEGKPEAVADEFGDVLFALVNFGRHLGIDGETALRGTNEKFRSRLHAVEQALVAKGSSLEQASLEEMEALWQRAKTRNTLR